MKAFLIYILIGFAYLSIADQAVAKNLVGAAQSAQSMFDRIGVAAIGIGITMGGIGLAHVGRMVLISGLIGYICVGRVFAGELPSLHLWLVFVAGEQCLPVTRFTYILAMSQRWPRYIVNKFKK